LRPDDREKIAAAVRNLDRESVYFRLFSYRSELTERGLDRIMAVDPAHEVVLVVTQSEGDAETVIGSARLIEDDVKDVERTAEVAFMVDNRHQGQGIAGKLMKHLASIARARGIVALEAEVLAKNKPMLAVFAKSGLPIQSRDGGVVRSLALSGESPCPIRAAYRKSGHDVVDGNPAADLPDDHSDLFADQVAHRRARSDDAQ
jgi:GNAT superfamily N-acetyltransferase